MEAGDQGGDQVLLTAHYSLLIAYCLLPTTYHLLPTTCYLLPTTYYLLLTTYYLLRTAHHIKVAIKSKEESKVATGAELKSFSLGMMAPP